MKMPHLIRFSSALLTSGVLVACATAQTGEAIVATPPAVSTNKAAEALKQHQAEAAPKRVLTPEELEQQAMVAERSRQRTAAVMKRDYAKGYEYSAPGYRALYSVDHFRNQVSGLTAWRDAEVILVDCESIDKCRTRVRVNTISFASGKRGATLQTHIDEVWLREGGQWYFVEYR